MQVFQTKPTAVKRYYAIHDSTGNVYHVKDATDDTAPIQIVQAAEFLEAHEPVVETPPPPVKRKRRPRAAVAAEATPQAPAAPKARAARTTAKIGTKPKRTRRTKAQIAADAAKAQTNGRKPKETQEFPGEYVTAGRK